MLFVTSCMYISERCSITGHHKIPFSFSEKTFCSLYQLFGGLAHMIWSPTRASCSSQAIKFFHSLTTPVGTCRLDVTFKETSSLDYGMRMCFDLVIL